MTMLVGNISLYGTSCLTSWGSCSSSTLLSVLISCKNTQEMCISIYVIIKIQYRTLMSELDGHGLWLNLLQLNVSLASMCGIFRSGLSSGPMSETRSGQRRSLRSESVCADNAPHSIIHSMCLRPIAEMLNRNPASRSFNQEVHPVEGSRSASTRIPNQHQLVMR
jgi:hypothetical protein